MELRSLFNNIFGKQKQQSVIQTTFQLLNDGTNIFSNQGTTLYNNDTARSCIHSIASHCGRLKPQHIRRVNDEIIKTNSNLEWTLQFKPNRYMNTYDFIYKTVTRLLLDNNAFIYINYLGGNNYEFFPINYANLELMEVGGELYCKFMFHTGQILTVPYTELIHLRRHFSDSDFFGSSQSSALTSLLDVSATIDAGIIATIQNSVKVRGILKFANAMLKPEDLLAQKNQFITDYLNIDNAGGIAATDTKAEFTPINPPSGESIIDASLQQYQKSRLFEFFGINEDILQAKHTADQFNTFYETTIEPIALQLSLELTNKIFTEGEKNHGNEIIFAANRLQYANLATKTAMASQLLPMGLFTINEMREIFNMEPIEGGDIRLQTLNVVDASIANDYQMGKTNQPQQPIQPKPTDGGGTNG